MLAARVFPTKIADTTNTKTIIGCILSAENLCSNYMPPRSKPIPIPAKRLSCVKEPSYLERALQEFCAISRHDERSLRRQER